MTFELVGSWPRHIVKPDLPNVPEEFFQKYHTPLPNELNHLHSVVGQSMPSFLADLRVPLFVKNSRSKVRVSTFDYHELDEISTSSPKDLRYYFRTDFGAVMDKKLIDITIWKAIRPNYITPENVCRFDFDWLSNDLNMSPEKAAMFNAPSKYALKEGGMYTAARFFLKKLKTIVRSVDSNCKVIIDPEDDKRRRMYSHAFRDKKNIIVLENE
jgi:hypothetical protein